MTFHKIVAIGNISLEPEAWERIKNRTERLVLLPKDDPKIAVELKDADAALLGFAVGLDAEQMNNAPELKYIGINATAYGWVDIDAAAKHGITVCNIPGYSTESVAEMIFAMLLTHTMQMEEGRRRARLGDYEPTGYHTSELKGKVFGVIGLGNTGRRVAQLARAFGCDARYFSRNRKPDAETAGIRYQELDELLASADILSLNLASSHETTGLMNLTRLNALKPGAILISTVPMDVIDLPSLKTRLAKQDLIFISEHAELMDPKTAAEFAAFPNCIFFPSVGFTSAEARKAKQEIFLQNIEQYLAGRPINTVN